MYQPLLHTLLNILEWMINPLYYRLCSQQQFGVDLEDTEFDLDGDLHQHEMFTELLIEEVNTLFNIIGIYIGLKTEAFVKLCRVILKLKISLNSPSNYFQISETSRPKF